MPLDKLATDMERSIYAVQRGFAAVAGETPKQCNRRLQLERAATLLLTEDRTILDVALEAGFQSHEGFTRAFTAHFGQSPRAFRSNARTRLEHPGSHAQWLLGIGPCIRVYRLRRHQQGREGFMAYDITIQDIDEITLLFKEARCRHADIGAVLGECLPAVFRYVTESSIQMVGPPMTVYMHWGPGMVTLRAGLPVAAGASGQDDIESMVLPAGRGAVTVHVGPYEGLGLAHAAIETFIHEQQLASAGPLREVYLTDPGEVPNPDEWRTQILWPIDS